MTVLRLYPRAAHVDEALEAELGEGGGAVVMGADHLSARQLLERAFSSRPRPVRVGPMGQRLLLDAVADEAAGEARALRPLAGTRGFAESLGRVIADWKLAGLSPDEVAALARRAGPSSRRLAALAALYARYAERLGDRADEADVVRAALATLRGEGGRARFLEGVERVIARHAAIDPRVLDVVEALAAGGVHVAPELPLVAAPNEPRPLLERAVEPLARRLERLTDLPIEPRYLEHGGDDDSPRARLLGQLFRRAADPRRQLVADAPVDLHAAPSPEVEARAVARLVRDLLDGGAAPRSIAIAARDSSQRDRVARWLDRYGVPFAEAPGRPATTSVPVRLALRLAELADDDVPREALIALISSRYVSGWIDARGGAPAIAPNRIARVLREAGVRDAADEEGVPGYRRRLGELARASDGSRRVEIERIAARVEVWLALAGALPAEGTIGEQAGALSRAIDALEIPLRARGYVADAEAGLDDVERVAHDQAAVAALQRMLADLPRAAVRAGLSRARTTRARFSRLLESLLAGEAIRPSGARGGTALLTTPEQLTGRRFAHVIACGLQDGVLPARAPEDPLLHDEDRRRFNHLAGRDALPLAAAEGEREPLVFLELCAAATERLHLFHALADGAGRPLLRSPFLDEIDRATGREARPIAFDPIPRAADCRLPAELRARAALEVDAPREGRLSPRDPDASAALVEAAAAAPAAALDRARATAAIERRRLAFFDGRAEPDRYSGRISDPRLLEALAVALPGSERRPLSASAIEDYARCGFRFFARRVLGAEPPEETGDELDALAGGRLHHRALERFFRDLEARGELPLSGRPDELRRLDESLDAVLAEWEESERRGHPALFAVRGRRVRRELRALVLAEGGERFFAPHKPRHFEHRFRVPITPPDGGEPLHVQGAIDRIDVEGDRAVVIDYKTGRSSTYRRLLAEDALLVTSFQLPLYAAAARATLGLREVSARYFAIRDAQPTAPLLDDGRLSLEFGAARPVGEVGAVRAVGEVGEVAAAGSTEGAAESAGHGPRAGAEGGAPTVGEALFMLRRSMREGRFAIAPRNCDHCALGAACRVVLRRRLDEGGA